MLYKEITDSADDKTNAQRPNRTNKTHRNESRRAVRSGGRNRRGEGGEGPGRGPQGRLAMSLSGGGPTGLGLLSLAFPSNIMTLVQEQRKKKKTQNRIKTPFLVQGKIIPALTSAGSSTECPCIHSPVRFSQKPMRQLHRGGC